MKPNIYLEQKKLIMKAIQKECIVAISTCSNATIQQIIKSNISITNFISTMWENIERRLQDEGQYKLLQPAKIEDFDPQ